MRREHDPLDTKYLRTAYIKRSDYAKAFQFDLIRIRRLSLVSDNRSQFYAWHVFSRWRTANRNAYAKEIALTLTVAPFSLETALYFICESSLGFYIPGLTRRLVSEVRSKETEFEYNSVKAREICKIALVICCYKEGFLSTGSTVAAIESTPVSSVQVANYVVDLLYEQVDKFGRERIQSLCLALKDKHYGMSHLPPAMISRLDQLNEILAKDEP